MLIKHLREELQDAKAKGWREEAQLVSRNAIVIAAAALCPLGVAMAVVVMILWDALGNMPWGLADAAIYYPVSGLAMIGLAVLLHSRQIYTLSMLFALAPFLWVPVFIGSGLYWALR
jgi:hypothetical protein